MTDVLMPLMRLVSVLCFALVAASLADRKGRRKDEGSAWGIVFGFITIIVLLLLRRAEPGEVKKAGTATRVLLFVTAGILMAILMIDVIYTLINL
jgi:hypothetical protein